MIENSSDIWVITKSFALIWVSVSLGLVFFYTAMTIRQTFVILRNTRKRLKKIDQILQKCQRSMGEGASGMIYIIEGVKILIDSLKKRSELKKKTTKKKAKTSK